jgi:hypothetical protein
MCGRVLPRVGGDLVATWWRLCHVSECKDSTFWFRCGVDARYFNII